MKLILLSLLSVAACFGQCTIQTINGTDPVSTGPAKLNANFTALKTCKTTIFSGTTVPGSVTGSLKGDFYINTSTNLAYQCFAAGPCTAVASGNWVCLNCTTGNGTVTVVGGGDLTSTQCVTGGGAQALQTPSANCTVDSSGNVTAKSVTTNDTTHSTGVQFAGLTSGGFMIAANDTASGSAVVYIWPSDPPSSFPKSLQVTGTVTCPTLAAGSPSTCYQLAWQ